MDIEPAKHAGKLAADVEVRQAQIAAINNAIANHWLIKSCVARNPETGDVIELCLEVLNDSTSQQSLAFILSIYQAELDALNAQLASAETWTP